jgi:hypothetical protein
VVRKLRAIPAIAFCIACIACAGSGPTSPTASSRSGPRATTAPAVAFTSLSVSPCPTTTITPGTTHQLVAQASLADGSSQDVSAQSVWVSTNRNIASVADDGLVTALIPGLTIVSAAHKNVRGECRFQVSATPPPAPLPQSSGEQIVINEFRSWGPNGGNDEFIELRNDAPTATSIGSWQVRHSPRTGTATTELVTLPAGVILNPGCYFLLTRSAKLEVYSGAAPGDASFGANLNDDGGLALFRADGALVDAVGMSLSTLYKEGVPLLSWHPTKEDRSYQRVGDDKHNNLTDFAVGSPSTPTNRAGVCSLDSR